MSYDHWKTTNPEDEWLGPEPPDGPEPPEQEPPMSYDTRCYELAEAFLTDTPDINNEKNRDELAQRIQQTAEDWIQYNEGPCECCGEARGKNNHKDCVFF
jgi:hypothetical protein